MSGQFLHQNLARGRWFELSLAQQLGNIGSEVGRARRSCGSDEAKFWNAAARALDLFYLTLSDKRWSKWRKKEICRACETFCDAVLGGQIYGGDLESLDRYFTRFALLAVPNR